MRFQKIELDGAFIIDIEPHADERGFFARTFCEREFSAQGLPTHFPQNNLSRNDRAGTLRGMHFERSLSQESKLVRCTAGAIHDVIVDLRAGSPTRFRWFGVELAAGTGRALFVPAGFAHGFVTLAEGTDVSYQMGSHYRPGEAAGFRFDDPFFGIRWPRAVVAISERDAGYPDFRAGDL
jgi:dTDP-4-dehydrorhamnose 3,5-epimerase